MENLALNCGGALIIDNTDIDIDYCLFSHNILKSNSSQGGGFYFNTL
jgi:hypothetical protein